MSRESVDDNESITTFSVQSGKIVDSDPPTGTVTINHVDKTPASADGQPRHPRARRRQRRRPVAGLQRRLVVGAYNNTSYDSIPQTLSWNLADAAHGGTNRRARTPSA